NILSHNYLFSIISFFPMDHRYNYNSNGNNIVIICDYTRRKYMSNIGVDTIRKEAWDKVTGAAKYNSDQLTSGIIYAEILTSTHAHAKIVNIDLTKALKYPGVQNIITGEYYHVLTGSFIHDRPPIAKDKVRYFGEPV